MKTWDAEVGPEVLGAVGMEILAEGWGRGALNANPGATSRATDSESPGMGPQI